MTDPEITKLCAEAMGFGTFKDDESPSGYNPLHDDAQAMALVKKFVRVIVRRKEGDWSINLDGARNVNLNRAICETVAKMRQK